MKIKLTKNDAQEVLHKMCVLNDTPDLQESYGISKIQAEKLCNTIPQSGGEWDVPDWGVEAVKGEMADHAVVLRDISKDARNGNEAGQSLRIAKQAKRLEGIFE